MAFLNVITRHLPARAELLVRNQLSLLEQTDGDYEQLLLIDPNGAGWEYARALLIQAGAMLTGRYTLILDDDDFISDPDAIATLRRATADNPPVVIFRGHHAELGVLPRHCFGARPVQGDIGVFDFILRADVYRECVVATSSSHYAHDYAMIAAAYDRHAAGVVWLDRVLCTADARRIGQ